MASNRVMPAVRDFGGLARNWREALCWAVMMTDTELIERATGVLRPRTVEGRLFGDVAAAVLSAAGDLFVGVSVDTPAWGICAERSALAAMVTAGETRVDRMVAVWQDPQSHKLWVLPPCGGCREFLRALHPDNLECCVILGREHTVRLRELLPWSGWPEE